MNSQKNIQPCNVTELSYNKYHQISGHECTVFFMRNKLKKFLLTIGISVKESAKHVDSEEDECYAQSRDITLICSKELKRERLTPEALFINNKKFFIFMNQFLTPSENISKRIEILSDRGGNPIAGLHIGKNLFFPHSNLESTFVDHFMIFSSLDDNKIGFSFLCQARTNKNDKKYFITTFQVDPMEIQKISTSLAIEFLKISSRSSEEDESVESIGKKKALSQSQGPCEPSLQESTVEEAPPQSLGDGGPHRE